jgi:hypothetical protein
MTCEEMLDISQYPHDMYCDVFLQKATTVCCHRSGMTGKDGVYGTSRAAAAQVPGGPPGSVWRALQGCGAL